MYNMLAPYRPFEQLTLHASIQSIRSSLHFSVRSFIEPIQSSLHIKFVHPRNYHFSLRHSFSPSNDSIKVFGTNPLPNQVITSEHDTLCIRIKIARPFVPPALLQQSVAHDKLAHSVAHDKLGTLGRTRSLGIQNRASKSRFRASDISIFVRFLE